MAKRSVFIKGSGPLSKPKRRFEQWLHNEGYDISSEMYPAAIHASTLVDDYMREYPERLPERILVDKHASDIGYISDFADEAEDEEEPEVDPDRDRW